MKPRTRNLASVILVIGLMVSTFGLASAGSHNSPSNVIRDFGIPLSQADLPTGNKASVNVAHFAPFADTEAGTSVTVRINGEDAITDFTYGEIVNTRLYAGTYLIEILPTGTDTVAISGHVTLEKYKHYTLSAIGDGTNQSLELFPLVDDTMPDWHAAKLRVAHLAPFASSDTEVDVCTDDGTVVIPDLAYKDFTDPYLKLPAGDYNLLIALAGTDCATVALDLPSISLAKGEIVDVFAIGGANSWPLEVTSPTALMIEMVIYMPVISK